MERDLAGYGKTPPRVAWPNDARIAISVVLNYEEGSERTPLYGDRDHEPAGEMADRKPAEARSLQTETQWEYGARAGVWRLLRLLDRYAIKATIFACGMALENNPEVGREISAAGHDVCGHGYRWVDQWHMGEAEEQESIRRCVDAIQRTTGRRPLGWFTKGGPSLHTRAILAEEGFLYDCDGLNDDLPYYASASGKPWLVVPYAFDTNDGRYWRNGWADGDQFFRYLRDAFDVLYAEGEDRPRMLSIGLHTRVSGRPGRSAAVERFIQYARGFPGVWFAGRDEIARWWLEHYPASQALGALRA
jgi:peptidoglycan/xylan/chitin deacetylase (PgdA/CDA1 family)